MQISFKTVVSIHLERFKKIGLLLWLLIFTISLFAQQVSIPRINLMPDQPAPYLLRDWAQVALKYDSLAFNIEADGTHLPLSAINENGINYNDPTISMATYVGQSPDGGAEAINVIPAVVGASLVGIDKSDQFGRNWVRMMRDFFNKNNGEDIYLNNYTGSSGFDWWYETMPNVFFYQLYDLYPETDDFVNQLTSVADRWLEAVKGMGGSATPWEVPYMNYRAWNFNNMEPLETGVKQPAASGAIAWILYHAYLETGEEDYRLGAEWAMEFLNNWQTNPNYELQLAYGIYTAARMNAELGTTYNLDKMMDWAFERGPLRGWGIITGNWGGYDCYGLRGEANDQGNDYAFLMNGLQQASALVPMARYQEQYANAIAKWLVNLANASRYFYPGFLPDNQQDHPDWAEEHDPFKTIAHESMKEQFNGYSPYATGDAVQGGWAPTNLSLYSSSHAGYIGAIVSETNVEKILLLNLNNTDFFSESYPSRLLWNPYQNDTTVKVNVGDVPVDIYESRTNQKIATSVAGEQRIEIPAKDSRLLVYLPQNASIVYDGRKSLVNEVVVDYENGENVSQSTLRIKALKLQQNPVEVEDSVFVYCAAAGENVQYSWNWDGDTMEGTEVLAMKAPADTGTYEIKVKISDYDGAVDSASVNLQVLNKIPFVPLICNIKANPRKIQPSTSTSLECHYYEENGDAVNFSWTAAEGDIVENNETSQWTAPGTEGDYYVYCTVSDVDGATTDSLKVMVRNMDDLTLGEPVLYLPFNGHALDGSSYQQVTQQSGLNYGPDSLGHENKVAFLDGSSFVRIENDESLNFTDALTVTGWFYPQHESSGEAYVVSHGSWEYRWKISLSDETLRATINTSDGILDLDSEKRISNDRWYHFAAVYTGQDAELYIDGRLNAFRSWQGQLNQSLLEMVVGKARPDQDYFYKGRIDEVNVFDHALAPDHIQELMANGLTLLPGNLADKPAIRIYPNPASKVLNLQLAKPLKGTAWFQLMSLTGSTLVSGSWDLRHTKKQIQLGKSMKETGLYLLSIQSEHLTYVTKILIVK